MDECLFVRCVAFWASKRKSGELSNLRSEPFFFLLVLLLLLRPSQSVAAWFHHPYRLLDSKSTMLGYGMVQARIRKWMVVRNSSGHSMKHTLEFSARLEAVLAGTSGTCWKLWPRMKSLFQENSVWTWRCFAWLLHLLPSQSSGFVAFSPHLHYLLLISLFRLHSLNAKEICLEGTVPEEHWTK